MDLTFSAGSIWTVASRTLTNSSPALVPANGGVNTLAASASVDFRLGVGQFEELTLGVKTGAAATASTDINMWDGTTAIRMATTGAVALTGIGFHGVNTDTKGFRATNNDGAVAATYIFCSERWTK